MADEFRPRSKRVGAETTVSRGEIMEPAFIQETLDSLEHYGVLMGYRSQKLSGSALHTERGHTDPTRDSASCYQRRFQTSKRAVLLACAVTLK